jgi:hypothetical protein
MSRRTDCLILALPLPSQTSHVVSLQRVAFGEHTWHSPPTQIGAGSPHVTLVRQVFTLSQISTALPRQRGALPGLQAGHSPATHSAVQGAPLSTHAPPSSRQTCGLLPSQRFAPGAQAEQLVEPGRQPAAHVCSAAHCPSLLQRCM